MTETLKILEQQLAENERHMDRYAHEMQSSNVPGEYEYFEGKCDDLMMERRGLKSTYARELRRQIGSMKRRMNSGEKQLCKQRNQLKRKYFKVVA